MCTMLLEPETLPAEKRSRKDSQIAVDELMARDRSFDEPFTREELQKIFEKEDERSSLFRNWQIRQQLDDYQLLSEREKQIVAELGLTPKEPEASTPGNPFEEEEKLLGINMFSSERTEFLDADMPREKKRRQMKADVLAKNSFRYFWRGENSGEIYVWLDNMNYAPEKEGFYYVRYRNSILKGNTTLYAHPVLVVQKDKLRPDQVEYMERKCRETFEAAKQAQEQREE